MLIIRLMADILLHESVVELHLGFIYLRVCFGFENTIVHVFMFLCTSSAISHYVCRLFVCVSVRP